MLRNTFCHMPGIGPKAEARLWDGGILSWEHALQADALPLSPARADATARLAEESLKRLEAADARHFADCLAPNQHWRLFPEFRDSVAYLDIETTGLGGPGDIITVIGLYDGRSVRHYVYDRDLEKFRDDIRDYRMLVTYNGKTFDVPFIRNYLGLRMEHAHVDLRYVLHSLGYKGGLKGCEKQLGLDRGDLDGVDGYFAVLLWRDFKRGGNERALETLLAYNTEDVVNLETLMVMAYNMKVKDTPFAESHPLPLPAAPDMSCRPHLETITRIKRDHGWV